MKPILIIKAPMLTMAAVASLKESISPLKKVMTDYHVLVVNANCNDYEFEVFYEKDFTGAQGKELKKEILKFINK